MQFIHQPRRLISEHNSHARQQAFSRKDEREKRKMKEKEKHLFEENKPIRREVCGVTLWDTKKDRALFGARDGSTQHFWSEKMAPLGRMALGDVRNKATG